MKQYEYISHMDNSTTATAIDNPAVFDDIARYETLASVKRRLNRKLALAQKYGYAEYADELAELLAAMHHLSK